MEREHHEPSGPPHLEIVHLSDIHFGKNHRFQADPDAAGKAPKDHGYPSLFEKLIEDLAALERSCLASTEYPPRLAICITGDLTQIASNGEFAQAEDFIRKLADHKMFGRSIGLDNILCVPGNHDLKYDDDSVAVRWTEFADFHNRLFGTKYSRDAPELFVQMVQPKSLPDCLFLCINSAAHVVKDDVEAKRGRLGQTQLTQIDAQIKKVVPELLRNCIKVALVHHHPILIPDLVEPGSNYDAIYNSGLLLSKLRSSGFHLVLHGHKHWPVTFSDDTRAAYSSVETAPMIVVAGGSVGSKALPPAQSPLNCYNRISARWDAAADQYRIRVETRGLDIWDDKGRPELPSLWKWKTLAIDDRLHLGPTRQPTPGSSTILARADHDFSLFEQHRTDEYSQSRGCFPVVDVVPSLIPGVYYEARVWLVVHKSKHFSSELPKRVTWYAGPKFDVSVVDRAADKNFCAIFHYYGPMLVQAVLEFDDGSKKSSYIYVRRPENYSAGTVEK